MNKLNKPTCHEKWHKKNKVSFEGGRKWHAGSALFKNICQPSNQRLVSDYYLS